MALGLVVSLGQGSFLQQQQSFIIDYLKCEKLVWKATTTTRKMTFYDCTPFNNYGPNSITYSYKFLSHKHFCDYSHVNCYMTSIMTKGLRFKVDGWHVPFLLHFFLAGENIVPSIVIVYLHFMKKDK